MAIPLIHVSNSQREPPGRFVQFGPMYIANVNFLRPGAIRPHACGDTSAQHSAWAYRSCFPVMENLGDSRIEQPPARKGEDTLVLGRGWVSGNHAAFFPLV